MSRVNLQRMGRQDAKNPWNELSSSILMLFINFLITDILFLISATLAQTCTTQKHTKWFLFGVMKMIWTQIATVSHNLVQFSSVTQSCLTLCDPMDCSTPGLPVHHQLLEFTQTHVHRVGDAIQPSHPLSSPIPPSSRVFSNESTLRMRWPKYCSFSFSISPSKEHPGLISFRMDWLDLLAVQGTLKSLLQHHSSKASIHRCSAFSKSNSHIHT